MEAGWARLAATPQGFGPNLTKPSVERRFVVGRQPNIDRTGSGSKGTHGRLTP